MPAGTAAEAVMVASSLFISRRSAALLEPLFAAGGADSTAAVAAGRSLKVGLEYTVTTVAFQVQAVCCVL
jgi:hypothetical protein